MHKFHRRLFRLILIMCSVVTTIHGATIPVSDVNVQSGLSPYNWVTREGFMGTAVNAASVKVSFNGTFKVGLEVDTAHLAPLAPSRYPILAWTVNGGPLQTHQLKPAESTVLLSPSAMSPTIDLYVKGMSPFEDRFAGDVPVNSVKITGFSVDAGGSTKVVVQPPKIWLNIGDSILSGDAAAYSKGQGRPPDDLWAASEDGRSSYGYLLARHYGFRETRIAYGGYNWGGGMGGVGGLDQLIDQKTSTVSRLTNDFLIPAPAVVLVNLGENGVPAESNVIQSLTKLRSRSGPSTTIIMMIPVSGRGRAELTKAFQNYQTAAQDKNTTLIDLGPITFATVEGQHPNAAGHEAIYKAALPKLDSIIKRIPIR